MAMTVFLMRHGQAENGMGKADSERALTDEGIDELERAASALAASGVRCTHGLSSPLQRARQTAELMWRALGGDAPLETVPLLQPGAIGDEVLGEIQRTVSNGTLLVVGHMPDLLHIAAHLLSPDGGRVSSFIPGGLARIDFDDGARRHAGRLAWYRTPTALAAGTND